jgi:hypothetical protein
VKPAIQLVLVLRIIHGQFKNLDFRRTGRLVLVLSHRSLPLGQLKTLIDNPILIVPQFNKVNAALGKDTIVQADAEHRGLHRIVVPDRDGTEKVASARMSASRTSPVSFWSDSWTKAQKDNFTGKGATHSIRDKPAPSKSF